MSDDGAGMDKETAAHAFELFFQAQQGPERRRGGLGIGLTLVRRIVELHGGTIDVASDGLGTGATFALRLPALAPPDASVSVQPEGGACGGRRVVIVEDSDDARLSLQRILEDQGHIVHTAADGPSGFEKIVHFEPDVALIDIGSRGSTALPGAAAPFCGIAHVPDRTDRLWPSRGPQSRPPLRVRRALHEAAVDGSAPRVGRDGSGWRRRRPHQESSPRSTARSQYSGA